MKTFIQAIGLLVLILATALSARAQAIFTSMAPTYGPVGTEVVVTGNFPATGIFTLRAGGASAGILERTTTFVRFNIPGAATSGTVELTIDGTVYKFPGPLTVTRPLTVRIAPETQTPTNYVVGTLYSDAAGTGPIYIVDVAKGEPSIVTASAGEADPVLMAIATDADIEIILNARTTALAYLYVVPGVQVLDQSETTRRLNFFAARPEFITISNAIQNQLAARQDYLSISAVEQPMLAALEAFFANYQPPAPPPLAGGGGNNPTRNFREDFVNDIEGLASGYPRDLETPGFEGLRKLVTSTAGSGVNERGLPIIKVKVKSRPSVVPLLNFLDINPLDWMANLYELDPRDTDINTLTKVQNLRGSFSAVYDRTNPRSIGRLHVKAKLAFRALDVFEVVTDQVMGFFSPGMVAYEYLEIPADRPGIYMIRAFSGARFSPQSTLIQSLPEGQREANIMTALNLMMAAHDTLSILFKYKPLLGDECFNKASVSLAMSLAVAVERETAQGSLSPEIIGRLFLFAAKSGVKDFILKCLVAGSGRQSVLQLSKVMVSAIDLTGKISSGGKVVERVQALGNVIGSDVWGGPQHIWTAQAMEDTIVVVGNPWQPQVTGFFPQEGYRGSIVRIDGQRFSTVTNQNLVTFGQLSTDPENPPVSSRAEVLSASDTSLVIRVPEDADTGFITVTVAGKGTASTTGLNPPFQQFVVLEDPVITGIFPNPPLAGQAMQIRGNNFARFMDKQDLVFGVGPAVAAVGTRELLFVRTPNSTAPNSVKVRIGNRESNVLPFTPVLPATIATGATLYVSTQLDGNVEDGKLSLREAILLASGGITALGGRNLTSPPTPRPPGLTYETDYVVIPPGGSGPGAATKDYVRNGSQTIDTTIFVTSLLPPLGSFDDYEIDSTISGGGFDGFRIIGGTGIKFRADAIRNFGGHGFVLSGTAIDHYIWYTLVENCGGDGFRMEGNALGNTLFGVQAKGCAQGLHLTGTAVAFNKIDGEFRGEFSQNLNFGVLIDNGATLNELTAWRVNSNSAGGIRLVGADTVLNIIQGRGPFIDGGVVHDNGGPGIWINSPSNIVRSINIAGSQGDGILLENPTCHEILVSDVRSGYDHWRSQPRPNLGSGLRIRSGAHRIFIGNPDGDISDADVSHVGGMNCFAGNRDNGIWVEGSGTRNIQINLSIVGAGVRISDSFVALPNGTNGIVVSGNADSVIIGGAIHANVVVANHTNGAGIFFSRTTNNYVLGCKIGRDDIRRGWLGNKYGIHLTDSAFANVIGMRGIRQVNGVGDEARIYDSQNFFYGNVEAGILLESGGDPSHTLVSGEVSSGGNVIQNNVIGSSDVAGLENRVGILLRQGAILNRIGGANPSEANIIRGNQEAGILIDGAVITRPALANRIVGNKILRQGWRVTTPGDPLAGFPSGVGIALTNGAFGHIIGGNNPGEANLFADNYVAIQMIQSRSNQVIGNNLNNNKAGGIVLLKSAENVIGPFNEIYENGLIPSPLGGVVLKSATNNSVIGNWIGLRSGSTFTFGDGNNPYGIGLLDSPLNVIGDLGGKNIIVGSGTHGVMISGAGCVGNQVANNHIGFSPVPGVFASANKQAGVLLINGAQNNIIGGERTSRVGNGFLQSIAPNYIQRNVQDGVRVDGAATIGNSILYNSIADHSAGIGIQNLNGGNIELPPPTLTSANGVDIVGSAGVPNGSLVQIFSDDLDEGRNWLDDVFVNGGQFQYSIPPAWAGRPIKATVTHATQGHTSEFGPLVINTNYAAGLMIQRVNQPPLTLSMPVPGPVAVASAFKLRAFGNPALVVSMTFKATGFSNESLPGTAVYLYRDEDKNGVLTQEDFQVAGPKTFTTDNGSATFTQLGRVIDPGTDQHWFLVLLASTNSAPSQTFSFEITSQTFVTSRALITGETITESGEFPLLSDTLQITVGQTRPSNLRITRGANGDLILNWTGSGVMEYGPSVIGPWIAIPDASVPFKVAPTQQQQQQFFRFWP